jgi:hypothetical protein
MAAVCPGNCLEAQFQKETERKKNPVERDAILIASARLGSWKKKWRNAKGRERK